MSGTEVEWQKNWRLVAEMNPQGFALWGTALGTSIFYAPIESLTVDDNNKVRIVFKWIAAIAGRNFRDRERLSQNESWTLYQEGQTTQEFDGDKELFALDENPQRGKYVSFANAVLYFDPIEELTLDQVKQS